jgi:hypothetical protein
MELVRGNLNYVYMANNENNIQYFGACDAQVSGYKTVSLKLPSYA